MKNQKEEVLIASRDDNRIIAREKMSDEKVMNLIIGGMTALGGLLYLVGYIIF